MVKRFWAIFLAFVMVSSIGISFAESPVGAEKELNYEADVEPHLLFGKFSYDSIDRWQTISSAMVELSEGLGYMPKFTVYPDQNRISIYLLKVELSLPVLRFDKMVFVPLVNYINDEWFVISYNSLLELEMPEPDESGFYPTSSLFDDEFKIEYYWTDYKTAETHIGVNSTMENKYFELIPTTEGFIDKNGVLWVMEEEYRQLYYDLRY